MYLLPFLLALNSSYFASTQVEVKEASPYRAIHSIDEIFSNIEALDSDTVVVFDVDEVLVTTKDSFLRPEGEAIFLARVQQAIEQAKTDEEKEELERKLSISLTEAARFILEPALPKLIATLQEKKIKIVALTSHPTGKFGILKSVEEWKVNTLKECGFHFERSFPAIKAHTFTSLAKDGLPPPLYLDGVLFSRGYSKGEVLLAFFDTLACYKPKRVICIDDLVKNHESLHAHLQKEGISYSGYWYRKAALTADEINETRIHQQFDHLLKTGTWLNN